MSDPRILQVVIQPDPPARLDKALARDVPAEAALSRSRLARLIADGQVRRGGAVLDDPRARVAAGEVLELTVIDDAEPDLAGEAIPELHATSHYWRNTGPTKAVLLSSDLLPVGGDAKMM